MTVDRYSLERSLFFQAYRVGTSFAQSMMTDLRPFGINLARWRILSILRSRNKSTIREITDITGYKQPIVSRTVTEMEHEGLLRRTKSSGDQRVVDIELTPAGDELFDELFPLVEAHRRKALKGLSGSDQKQLMKYLKLIRKNLHAES